MSEESGIKVFISYSHDPQTVGHRDRVLALSERLRADGVETILDRYVEPCPEPGWQRWMLDSVDEATHVLLVCTETYYQRFRGKTDDGKGVNFEGVLFTQEIYDEKSRTDKFIPVLFDSADTGYMPEPVCSRTYHVLQSEDEYQELYDALLDQAGVEPRPVGELKRKPRERGEPLRFEANKPAVDVTSAQVDISRIIKYAPEKLIGRETETALLKDSWQKVIAHEPGRPHVLGFVALGGEGKTSLVAKWLAGMAGKDWPNCDSVFAWSFYSQGSREQVAVSSDLFLSEALKFFGDSEVAGSAQGAYEKGQRLAELVGGQRSLLILDGVEPLQYPPSSPTGSRLKDQGVEALLKGLAASSNGLCIVTTRYSIPDLAAFAGTTWHEEELKRLSREAGVALLKAFDVRGNEIRPEPTRENPDPLNEYEQLVEDVKGHALTLHLLGSYLRDAHEGDITQRDHINLSEVVEEQGGHAFRVLDACVRALETGPAEHRKVSQRALAILKLMGLFDRPATADCLEALWTGEAIPNLTEPLIGISREQRNIALKRLESAWLITINRNERRELLSIDSHPLIREYFARQLRGPDPNKTSEVWRAAHRRLYEHLCETTNEGDQPTLEELQPLYQAVAHGCHAGMVCEADEDVYYARIKRTNEHYSSKKLGAFGSDLGAIACFFDQPWSRMSSALTPEVQAWYLNDTAIRLRAVGRLIEAIEPLRATLDINVVDDQWKNAATCASTLSELELTLGEVSGALSDAERSVTYADRSGDASMRVITCTKHADALQQSGRRSEAESLFREAEQMQAEDQPAYPLLYSLRGFQYCDLLLAPAEREVWRRGLELRVEGRGQEDSTDLSLDSRPSSLDLAKACRDVTDRATQTLKWAEQNNVAILDIALNHLTLSHAALYESLLSGSELSDSASPIFHQSSEIEAAVSGLRRAGQQIMLPHALLTRAWQRSLLGRTTGPDSAQSDLDEAWEIASRGPMPLFMADIHLHRARLFGPLTQPLPRGGEEQVEYPWESVKHDLSEARRLIEKHGYGRRTEELEDAEAALLPQKSE